MQCEHIVETEVMMIRTHSELVKFTSFIDRFNYLKLGGTVGTDTFGFERYLNQVFYKSPEWRKARETVIIRDNGCDLGVPGHEIYRYPIVHHLNPISIEDIRNRNPVIFDPEFLILTVLKTHNAIHYGDDSILLINQPIERSKNDTIPWRR